VFVTVAKLRWARIGAAASGAGEAATRQNHAFWRDGAEKQAGPSSKGDGDGAVGRVAGRLRDLLGAQKCLYLYDFLVDISHNPLIKWIYAALIGVILQCSSRWDRRLRTSCGRSTRSWSRCMIGSSALQRFSTSVDLKYPYGEVAVRLPLDDGQLNFWERNFDRGSAEEVHVRDRANVGARVREITMDVFAHDESASVQVRRMRGNNGVVADSDSVISGCMT